jgi:hypothetical protein
MPSLPVTGIALFYMWIMFVPHREHIPPRPLTETALLFFYDEVLRTFTNWVLFPRRGIPHSHRHENLNSYLALIGFGTVAERTF